MSKSKRKPTEIKRFPMARPGALLSSQEIAELKADAIKAGYLATDNADKDRRIAELLTAFKSVYVKLDSRWKYPYSAVERTILEILKNAITRSEGQGDV